MTDKEIKTIATLITANNLYISAFLALLVDSGITTKEKYDDCVDNINKEQFEFCVMNLTKEIREMLGKED